MNSCEATDPKRVKAIAAATGISEADLEMMVDRPVGQDEAAGMRVPGERAQIDYMFFVMEGEGDQNSEG